MERKAIEYLKANLFADRVLLSKQRMVSLKEAIFTDGTKIESVADKYTFVWHKSIKHHKEKIKSQLDELENMPRMLKSKG